jgi:periplasmic iron binding protein
VLRKRAGTLVVLLIVGGIFLILGLNLNLSSRKTTKTPPPRSVSGQDNPSAAGTLSPSSASRPSQPGLTATANSSRPAAPFREYPIGEDVEQNQMRISAVWLPAIQMNGLSEPSPSSFIHIEADIHATEGNRNGFPKDEFVPYLTVHYTIVSLDEPAKSPGVTPITGTMMPMTARDGWHYGASIEMPRAGRYKVTYSIDPPSAGRHSDPITGVDPWWKPFEVSFDWDYQGPA